MDYPNRKRLKILGRVQLLDVASAQFGALGVQGGRAKMERGFLVQVEAFDWNCPQHITPRYTEAEIERLVAPLIEENRCAQSATTRFRELQPQLLRPG